MQVSELKRLIADACQRLWARGLVANHDGNITYKISDAQFLATPTSFSKKDVTEDDILLVDGKGTVVEGKHKVFSEIAVHFAVYAARPDVKSVVHGHPVAAGGIALAGKEIGTPGIPEAIVSLGRGIYLTKFISPLDYSDLGGELSRVLAESDAFLMPGNGAWAVGTDVTQAYLRLELVEQIAQAHLAAEKLGGVRPLPRALVEELLEKRGKAPVIPAAAPSLSVAEDLKVIIRTELEKILSNS